MMRNRRYAGRCRGIRYIRTVIAAAALFPLNAYAQPRRPTLGLECATEVQTDFGRGFNWVSLVSPRAGYSPWRNGSFAVQTISICKIRPERIVDDLQTFSNIEEDNMGLNLFLAGYTHVWERVSLFGGIRNVNEDYFTGDYAALFTNSSCGIHPTVSCNFPVANYPLAGVCLHGEFRLAERVTLKTSLYNGVAGALTEGSLFRAAPKRDGIFNMTQLGCDSGGERRGFYTAGVAFRSRFRGIPESRPHRKGLNYALWGSAEQALFRAGGREAGILLEGSFAPFSYNDCYAYYGTGVVLTGFIAPGRQETLGLSVHRAVFHDASETAVELTWKCEVLKNLIVQPALHSILGGGRLRMAALFRMNYAIGN